jgi:flagellar motor protein MotB
MSKRCLVVMLGSVLFLTGCVSTENQKKQLSAMKGRLKATIEERDRYKSQLSELRQEHAAQTQELREAKKNERELAGLLERLKAAREEREQKLAKMRKLVKNITGMSVQSRPEGDFIVIENKILFEPGKIDLSEQARETLSSSVAQYLEKNLRKDSQQTVRVDGHTDGVPIQHSEWKDNFHLSAMRAHAVMQHLVGKGVPRDQMYICGFGPTRPLVEPEEAHAPVPENRRVEILLVPQARKNIEQILEEFRQ